MADTCNTIIIQTWDQTANCLTFDITADEIFPILQSLLINRKLWQNLTHDAIFLSQTTRSNCIKNSSTHLKTGAIFNPLSWYIFKIPSSLPIHENQVAWQAALQSWTGSHFSGRNCFMAWLWLFTHIRRHTIVK